MAKKKESNPADFCRIPGSLIERKGDLFPFDVYLKLSDSKVVKISHKNESIVDVYAKYRAKGVKEVYANKPDYEQFLSSLKDELSVRIFDPDTMIEERVELVNSGYEVVKESFEKIGVNEQSIEMAKAVSMASYKVVSSSPNLFQFFQQFKEKCQDEFMDSMLVGFMSTCMISTFDWQTTTIKEKMYLAATLCDIMLTPEDFAELKKVKTPRALSNKVLLHPQKTADLLRTDGDKWVSPEVLNIIEQHHEQPDGSGFPRALSYNRITPLSAIYIVAAYFVDEMKAINFDFRQRREVFQKVLSKYGKGEFKKAANSLATMLELI